MVNTVALLGAAGKMGARCRDKLLGEDYNLLLCEKGEGIKRLEEKELKATPVEEAVPSADVVVLAVPDVAISSIARSITPMLKTDAALLVLDASVAYAGGIPMRDDVTYVVAHPCHVSPYRVQETPEAQKDLFGGTAIQDILIALVQGTEESFTTARQVCCAMWDPVDKCYRVSLEQLAIMEPMVAEVLGAATATAIKEAVDVSVEKFGIARETAQSFMAGHMGIELAIVFGLTDAAFSDGCKVAIELGKKWFFKPEWKEHLFSRENILKTIDYQLHPEKLEKKERK